MAQRRELEIWPRRPFIGAAFKVGIVAFPKSPENASQMIVATHWYVWRLNVDLPRRWTREDATRHNASSFMSHTGNGSASPFAFLRVPCLCASFLLFRSRELQFFEQRIPGELSPHHVGVMALGSFSAASWVMCPIPLPP